MTDNVNHPAHYTSHPSGIECIQVTRYYCFSIGNAIKYLWRAGLKASADKTQREKEIEDLKKKLSGISTTAYNSLKMRSRIKALSYA